MDSLDKPSSEHSHSHAYNLRIIVDKVQLKISKNYMPTDTFQFADGILTIKAIGSYKYNKII